MIDEENDDVPSSLPTNCALFALVTNLCQWECLLEYNLYNILFARVILSDLPHTDFMRLC